MIYDVVIIGAGVTGCCIARELSRMKLSVLLTERENDVSCGATRANSAIIHAGYDPEPGTLMARLNVEGNRMTEDICRELDVPFRRIGSLVLAFDGEELKTVEKLYHRGVANGVPGLRLIGRDELRALEPNVSEDAVGALLAPSAGIINPWEYAVAMAENAVHNGAHYRLRFRTTAIARENGVFTVASGSGESVRARYVVNAAGTHSAEIARLGLFGESEDPGFRIIPSKGQYYLLDKSQGGLFGRVMFQCPSNVGKGVLVAPTVHGNLIAGPDAVDVADPDDTGTTRSALDFVRKMASRTTGAINYRDNIRNFAGIRANSDRSDFIIEASPVEQRFINVAGIKSPGLSSAPEKAARQSSPADAPGFRSSKRKTLTHIAASSVSGSWTMRRARGSSPSIRNTAASYAAARRSPRARL